MKTWQYKRFFKRAGKISKYRKKVSETILQIWRKSCKHFMLKIISNVILQLIKCKMSWQLFLGKKFKFISVQINGRQRHFFFFLFFFRGVQKGGKDFFRGKTLKKLVLTTLYRKMSICLFHSKLGGQGKFLPLPLSTPGAVTDANWVLRILDKLSYRLSSNLDKHFSYQDTL